MRERLGPKATGGLLDVLETARREWSEDVIEGVTFGFTRRRSTPPARESF